MPADRRPVYTAVLIVACLLSITVGCRERPTTVAGVVTLDGKPLTISRDTRGTVIFEPDGGHGTMATGLLDPSGHFNLSVGSSFVVPPGKYQVAISVSRELPKSDQGEAPAAEFIVPHRYASTRESGLRAEVVPGENNLQFDVTSGPDDPSSNSIEPPKDRSETGNAEPMNKTGDAH
jgi:hypothetical protein